MLCDLVTRPHTFNLYDSPLLRNGTSPFVPLLWQRSSE